MKRLSIGLAGALCLAMAPVGAQGVSAGQLGFGIGFGPFDTYPAEAHTSAGYWGAPAWIDALRDQEGVERYPVVVASFAYADGRQAMAQGSWQDIERTDAIGDQH